MASNALKSAFDRLDRELITSCRWAVEGQILSSQDHQAEFASSKITREVEIRDAISQSCRVWIQTGFFPAMSSDDAFYIYFRLFYAHCFSEWLLSFGARFHSKKPDDLLDWLLIDSWSQMFVSQWKSRLHTL